MICGDYSYAWGSVCSDQDPHSKSKFPQTWETKRETGEGFPLASMTNKNTQPEAATSETTPSM